MFRQCGSHGEKNPLFISTGYLSIGVDEDDVNLIDSDNLANKNPMLLSYVSCCEQHSLDNFVHALPQFLTEDHTVWLCVDAGAIYKTLQQQSAASENTLAGHPVHFVEVIADNEILCQKIAKFKKDTLPPMTIVMTIGKAVKRNINWWSTIAPDTIMFPNRASAVFYQKVGDQCKLNQDLRALTYELNGTNVSIRGDSFRKFLADPPRTVEIVSHKELIYPSDNTEDEDDEDEEHDEDEDDEDEDDEDEDDEDEEHDNEDEEEDEEHDDEEHERDLDVCAASESPSKYSLRSESESPSKYSLRSESESPSKYSLRSASESPSKRRRHSSLQD
jgi:hypothetical protein